MGTLSASRERERRDNDEGGREGNGEVARTAEALAALDDEGAGKTDDRVGRDFIRIEDGIVNRSAAVEDGVDGLVGGTACSRPCIRLVEFVCDFAREVAVGSSYRASLVVEGPAGGGGPAWD